MTPAMSVSDFARGIENATLTDYRRAATVGAARDILVRQTPILGRKEPSGGSRVRIDPKAAPAAPRSGGPRVESHAAATNDSVQPLRSAGDRGTVRVDTANVRDDRTALPRVNLGQALVLHRSCSQQVSGSTYVFRREKPGPGRGTGRG